MDALTALQFLSRHHRQLASDIINGSRFAASLRAAADAYTRCPTREAAETLVTLTEQWRKRVQS